MGDLKDAGPGGDKKTENDNKVEAIDVDVEAGQEVEAEDENAANELRAQMASMLLNSPLFSLPKVVRRSVRALKNLQLQHVNHEVEFFKELHLLEMKYEKVFEPLYERRAAIVSGAVVPTDEECDFKAGNEIDVTGNEDISDITHSSVMKLFADNDKVKADEESGDDKESEDIKGIPEFWLQAFKNAPALADMIEEYDEPILKHLMHVKAVTSYEPMSFSLEFHFEPNEYFTNTVLTKFYELRCTPDEADVFAFEGPEIVKCKGCTIDWQKGKNITVKTIKKKQKHKARGAVRTVTKTIANDSFFNFFTPPEAPENEDDMDEEMQGILSNDFEVGNLIKDRIIPHAVLFFTGENLIDDDFDEEDDEEDDDEFDEDEDEESEDDDENDNQTRKKSKGQAGKDQPAPPECKQQ